jgi:hypothetical protein
MNVLVFVYLRVVDNRDTFYGFHFTDGLDRRGIGTTWILGKYRECSIRLNCFLVNTNSTPLRSIH